MEQTAAAARLLSTEDCVLEILHRVSTDVAALFRCGVACKRWRVLVADRSFLRRCWPENVSTLLGFVDRQHLFVDVRSPYRLFFMPSPAGSVLGTQRRRLTSMVHGLPDDDSPFAQPLAARHGLLLVRLVSRNCYNKLVQMAVCDPLNRRCHMLPPLEVRVSFVSCTILTGAECGQHQQPIDNFKVLVIVLFSHPKKQDDHECNLYTFLSTESRWSTPTKCFDEIYRHDKSGFMFPVRRHFNNVVRGMVAHWLVAYYFDHAEEPPRYYILDVRTDTGHTSMTEISIPAKEFGKKFFQHGLTLGVTADGSLSLFCMHDEPRIRRIHMWKQANDADTEIWLHTRVIDLNIPRRLRNLWDLHMLPMEKSDTLFIIDEHQCVYKIDVETRMVEEQQFQNGISIFALPMIIEWPTLFASRLG